MAALKSWVSKYSSPSRSQTSPTSRELLPNSSSLSLAAVSIMSMAAQMRPNRRQSRLMFTQQSPPFLPRIAAALTKHAIAFVTQLASRQQVPTQKYTLDNYSDSVPKTSYMWSVQIWQNRMQSSRSSWQMLATAATRASFFYRNSLALAGYEGRPLSGGMLRRSCRKCSFSRTQLSISCLASMLRLTSRYVLQSRHTEMPNSNSLNISFVTAMCACSNQNNSRAITIHQSNILWLQCQKYRLRIYRRPRTAPSSTLRSRYALTTLHTYLCTRQCSVRCSEVQQLAN